MVYACRPWPLPSAPPLWRYPPASCHHFTAALLPRSDATCRAYVLSRINLRSFSGNTRPPKLRLLAPALVIFTVGDQGGGNVNFGS